MCQAIAGPARCCESRKLSIRGQTMKALNNSLTRSVVLIVIAACVACLIGLNDRAEAAQRAGLVTVSQTVNASPKFVFKGAIRCNPTMAKMPSSKKSGVHYRSSAMRSASIARLRFRTNKSIIAW
jgi:hypothetical protein